MKVICSKENLLEGINIVQKAVSSKSTLPLLEGILVEADEKLKLTGNDLEIGIESYIDADIIQKGRIVINSRIFGEIIRKLPDSEVLIQLTDNDNVIIECENSYFKIKGINSDGFPVLPLVDKEKSFKINQKILREMIRQTLFAVSTDENRLILTGSLIECTNNELAFVSIDGFRLALRKNRIESEENELKVVVPGKTLNEIVKILQPIDKDVNIYSTKNQIMFDLENCRVVSRLLEGDFLNYRSIIPEEYETKIKIKTKDFLYSIERASLLITSEERRYPVNIKIADDKIIITSNTDVGVVKEEINVDMEGKDLEIGFNPRYLIEALKVIEDEYIQVFFTTSVGPCTLKPLEDDSFVYLVLPVRR